jgi:uncharacterized protein YjbI with pentapeptide repeats
MSEDKSESTWGVILSGTPEAHPWRQAALWIGGFLYAVIAFWLLGHFVQALIAGTEGDPKLEGIRNLGLILFATIGAPFVIYRTWVLGRQAKTAEKQSELAEDRNFSDLFTKAVEQLGADKIVKRHATDKDGNFAYDENGVPVMQETTEPNLEVRLGAIYALQRISRASEKDHIPIMETLCAYIRENAIGGEPKEFRLIEIPNRDEVSEREFRRHILISRRKLREEISVVETLRSDIRSALTVIKDRSQTRREYEAAKNYRLDFRRANFQKADLTGADFKNANLSHARLEGANLMEVNMIGAELDSANLTGAYLSQAKMDNASFKFVTLDGANMFRAHLGYAKFCHSNIRFCRAVGAHMCGANLEGSNLDGSDFSSANMNRVVLEYANIGASNFHRAELEKANLTGSRINGANFRDANMREAILKETDFYQLT